MSGDVVMPAGDGTHRVIEADAIRALIGYVEQRDGLVDVPTEAELTDADLDAARQSGPHALGCPALDEDPDGIEQCECEPAEVSR